MQWSLIFLSSLLWSESESESKSESADDDGNTESPKADAEIIVYGQREVEQRRVLLDRQLEDNGYREGIRKGNKVVYRPDTVWHPSVIVYDSGWVDLRRTPHVLNLGLEVILTTNGDIFPVYSHLA